MGRNGPCALCNMSIPTALQELVCSEIRRAGRITFARFMELVLYDPQRGYYRASRSVVGTSGDFVTNVSATPEFGRLLALIAERYARRIALPEPLSIHEFGAHRGQLQSDIARAAPHVRYHTYEASDLWPQEIKGCVLANELLDALPFHRVQVCNGRWQEQFVTLDREGQLAWSVGDLSEPELNDALAPLPVEYMEGYSTEISLAARRWVERLSQTLTQGFAILIDYGHETPAYFAPSRFRGGLRTFHRHRRSDDPFADVGERDITCDVHFSDVIESACKNGLSVWEFAEQGRFFMRHAARSLQESLLQVGSLQQALLPQPNADGSALFENAPMSEKQARGLLTLTHPAHFGMAFKVLVLGRGERPSV